MITSKLGDAIGLEIKDLDVTKISNKETINTIAVSYTHLTLPTKA